MNHRQLINALDEAIDRAPIIIDDQDEADYRLGYHSYVSIARARGRRIKRMHSTIRFQWFCIAVLGLAFILTLTQIP